MSRQVLICVIVFLVIYLGWCAFMIIAVAKSEPKKKKKQVFDERQIAAQGMAYKWAFWAMFTYYFLYVIICGGAEIVWCDAYLGMLLGVLFGATVFALVCIFRDAYFRPFTSKASAVAVVNIICFSQGMIGLMHLKDGTVIEGGVLTADAVQLFLLLTGLVLDVAFIVKHRMEKCEAEE